MTNEEAIRLMKIETECVKRADHCDRNCSECDLLQKSDDLLEAYRIAISALENQPQWISVKDRLPPGNLKVLTYTPAMAEPITTQKHITYYREDDDEWNAYWKVRDGVSHWMPLRMLLSNPPNMEEE